MREEYNKSWLSEQKTGLKLKKPTHKQGKDWIIPILIVFVFYFFSLFIPDQNLQLMGQKQNQTEPANITNILDKPSLSDPKLKIETIATGFEFPTSITFLENNEILL